MDATPDVPIADIASPSESESNEQFLRKKIIHVLSIFPRLSHSMIQVAIGTSLPPVLWNPVLERLLLEEVVEKKQISAVTPVGRTQVYTLYQLKPLE